MEKKGNPSEFHLKNRNSDWNKTIDLSPQVSHNGPLVDYLLLSQKNEIINSRRIKRYFQTY
jgi:hypothetical protein